MAIKEATFKFNLPIFETDRLRLRPFNESDLNNLRTLETDFEVVKYLGNGQIRESEETLNYLKKHFKDYQKYGLGLYAVEDKITGAMVGIYQHNIVARELGLIDKKDMRTQYELSEQRKKDIQGFIEDLS